MDTRDGQFRHRANIGVGLWCLGCVLALCASAISVSYGGISDNPSRVGTNPRSLACKYVSPSGAQCSTPATGKLLEIRYFLETTPGRVQRFNLIRQDTAESATWKIDDACGSVSTRMAHGQEGVRISGAYDCVQPVRMCVEMQAAGDAASLPSSMVGLIRFKDVTLSVQGDYRLGAIIDSQKRLVKLCSNPRGQETGAWAIDLRSGSFDEVRDALLGIQAPISDFSGKTIGYAKNSPVVKDGYFFVDLTEGNQEQLLPLIQKSGFPYALIYASTWAASKGSYAFNPVAYPRGLGGLQRVVTAANRAGIRVGLHTLTGFVSKNDPYVQNGIPDRRLLEDEHSTLWRAIDSGSTTIEAADSLEAFPARPAHYGNTKAGLDLRIDDEIISCPTIVVAPHGKFQDCRRGLYGTKASSHAAGTTIAHLAERYGSYLADLSTSLKNEIGRRLAEIINQAGIDMVYFDGGEVGSANGDPGWYVAEQQIEVLKRVRRPLLVEGSGVVPRLWPFITRVATDDFAALAPVDYLDVHKIGRVHAAHANSLLPDHLGWVAILKETPSYPATTPEEIATYVARSLSLDIPIAVETRLEDLNKNPYSERLMAALKAGNDTIRAGVLSGSTRTALRRGYWYFTDVPGPTLVHLRLASSTSSSADSASIGAIANPEEKGVWLRIRNVRSYSADTPELVPFLDDQHPARVISELMINDVNRGELIESMPLGLQPSASSESPFIDALKSVLGKGWGTDLQAARKMVVDYEYSGMAADAANSSSGKCTVLNLQLEDKNGQFRDYLLSPSLGGRQRAILDYEASTPKVLRDYLPARASYAFKAAIYTFNFSAVTKLNIRWMNSCNEGRTIRLERVAMIKENAGSLRDVKLRAGAEEYSVIPELRTGEILDVYPDGRVSVCKGPDCSWHRIIWPSGDRLSGRKVAISSLGGAKAEITLGLLGDAVPVGRGAAMPR